MNPKKLSEMVQDITEVEANLEALKGKRYMMIVSSLAKFTALATAVAFVTEKNKAVMGLIDVYANSAITVAAGAVMGARNQLGESEKHFKATVLELEKDASMLAEKLMVRG